MASLCVSNPLSANAISRTITAASHSRSANLSCPFFDRRILLAHTAACHVGHATCAIDPRLGGRIGSELGQHFSHRALDRRSATTARSQGGRRYSHPRFNWRSRRKPDGEDATTAPDDTPIGQRAAAEGGEPRGHSPGWGSPVWQADSDAEEDDSGGIGAARKSSISHILTPDGKAFRPHRIILVRHGQSEGNVDEAAYTRIPDSKIALTRKGWEQAVERGRKLRELIEADGEEDFKVYFYVSPYTRTLQTLRGVGLAFERERIAGVREEPRIREQDFGNFQDREKMRREKKVRLSYGRFFYRFPDGESAADVYDRVTGFRETLRADIDVGRFQREEAAARNMNLVLVSHGLTLRVFLMRWYKWTVEQFEGLYNFPNAGCMIMQLGPGGRYSLRMHHSREELRAFGMTESMIDDQE
ncbi:unnamed protein product, partial [Closterium sp. NIES-65]